MKKVFSFIHNHKHKIYELIYDIQNRTLRKGMNNITNIIIVVIMRAMLELTILILVHDIQIEL